MGTDIAQLHIAGFRFVRELVKIRQFIDQTGPAVIEEYIKALEAARMNAGSVEDALRYEYLVDNMRAFRVYMDKVQAISNYAVARGMPVEDDLDVAEKILSRGIAPGSDIKQ